MIRRTLKLSKCFNKTSNFAASSALENGSRSFISTCRAVVVPKFGGPDVLEVRRDVKVPELGQSEVLVRTAAIGVNPLDWRVRSGYGRSLFEPLLPLILGKDISGEVAAVGSSVRQLHVGQEVFGALHPTAARGTYCDYAILSDEQLVPKPPSITHEEASAIPFPALTAWRALKSTARVTDGWSCCNSAVSSCWVQCHNHL
eukprot:TRINITY_DN11070_c0_g1_i1.p1 TRINITY_DN11070_c0_g1~~TRINITY_DN11070_c0_g1_i1.p1  ORF type:complete len:201 (+),score=28.52 TRINITY_DN11070_c0_g1_i1:328-930(+)